MSSEIGSKRKFERNETVRIVMAPTRCSVLAVKRLHCIPSPASSMDGLADKVAEWLSLDKRLILQSVSKNMSFHVEEAVERKMWDSLENGTWTRSATNANDSATALKETRSPSPKADDHKILLLLLSRFCGVVLLIRETRCEMCIEVGSSPCFPSTVPHKIVLSVTTSGWLYNVLELPLRFSFHSIACCAHRRPGNLDGATRSHAQTFDGSLSTRCDRVSGIISISRLASHAAQQQVLWECFGIRQMINSMQSSITDHRFNTTLWPPTPSNSSSPLKLQTVSALSHSSRLFHV